MHPTALINCQHFFDVYQNSFATEQQVKIVEIGSQDVNGSLRSTAPSEFEYVGADFVAGKGVDVILEDAYSLPFESESVDIVLTSSCFEHSEMFWLVFLEAMRILRPKGLLFLNVPSNGSFHRWPVDCWRFYPDSGRALVTWAKRNSINAVLLESYTSRQVRSLWNDFVAVFLKDEDYLAQFPERILNSKRDIENGVIDGSEDFINSVTKSEDRRNIGIIPSIRFKLAKLKHKHLSKVRGQK